MTKGEYKFRVRTYECDNEGLATLPAICNYLQEAASIHAETLGFSKTNFESAGENISWVLTRLVVEMEEYPKWEDEVTVVTFPRGGRKIVAWRDFELRGQDGRRLGVASSEWMLINLSTRRVVAIPEVVFSFADPANIPVLGPAPFTKFKFPDSAAQDGALSFHAQKSHIDLNGHVNNVHYIEWMLEPCESPRPKRMEVVFRSETFAGDEVRVAVADRDGLRHHRVYAPDGTDHIIAITA